MVGLSRRPRAGRAAMTRPRGGKAEVRVGVAVRRRAGNARSPGLRPRAPAIVSPSPTAYLQQKLRWQDGMQLLILLQHPENLSPRLQPRSLTQQPALSNPLHRWPL